MNYRCNPDLSLVTVFSGLVLLFLLPIGISVGVSGPLYEGIFVIHLLIQFLAVVLSIRTFLCAVKEENKFQFIYIFIFVIFFALISFQTIIPITAKDALIHHLAIPKLWIEVGKIHEIPWHEWSYYPMLIQLGFTGLMTLDLTSLTPLYHFSYLIILCAVCERFITTRLSSKKYGIWAFLFCLSLPLNFRLAGEPLVDLALALYFAIAFDFVCRSFEESFSGRDILLAGISLGLAMGTKYNALPGVLFFMLGFLLFGSRKKVPFLPLIKTCLVLTVISIFIALPWGIKNYSWTGNPVYPLFPESKAGTEIKERLIAAISPLEQRHWLYKESSADIFTLPIRMVLKGEDNNPKLFDGVLTPVLLLLPFALLRVGKNPWVLWSFVFSAGYFVFSILTASARTRYMAPIALPVISLFMLSLQGLSFNKKNKVTALIPGIVFSLHILFALQYSYNYLNNTDAFSYVFKEESQDSYLSSHLVEYTAIKKINQILKDKQDAKVYLLGTGNRFYLYNVPVIGGHFSEQVAITALNNSNTVDEFKNILINYGITDIFFHLDRVDTVLSVSVDPKKLKIWRDLIVDNGSTVYNSRSIIHN